MPKVMNDRRWNIIQRYFKDFEKVNGAEIGIWRGQMSQKLLEIMPNLKKLYMVDCWQKPKPGSTYFDGSIKIANMEQAEFDKAYEETKRRVSKYGKRCKILKMYSYEAAEKVEDYSLDFCFLDGDHSYQGVSNDICLWLPKVKGGGLLCGHDYDHPEQGKVKEAVHDFLGDKIILETNRTWLYQV